MMWSTLGEKRWPLKHIRVNCRACAELKALGPGGKRAEMPGNRLKQGDSLGDSREVRRGCR